MAVLAVLMLFPLKSLAWGEKGHGLVAEIAFKQLDRKTRKMILKSLDGMNIEDAANWMDAIKKDHAYDGLKPLHYINVEKGQPVQDVCCDNIVHTLETTIETLKHYKTLTPAELKTQLCYLFHLVGDLHQPLHVGYASDKGGNNYQIQFQGKGTNLHGLFDYGLIEAENIRLKDCLKAQRYTDEQIKGLQTTDVLGWANESRSHLDEMYATDGAKLSPEYVAKNTTLVKEQLQIAGIRLAGILKMVFEETVN